MMLTEYQRELLTKAKDILTYEHEKYICLALKTADDHRLSKDCVKLLEFIGKQLGGYWRTYGIWLHREHPEIGRNVSADDLRAGRIAWINYLLDLPPEDDTHRVYPDGKCGDVN